MILPVKHIIFDFDGVVADTETVFAKFDRELINNVLMQAALEIRLTFDEVRKLAGNDTESKLKIIEGRYNVDLKPYKTYLIQTRNERRKTLFQDNKVPLGRNLECFLKSLKTEYAVATNKVSEKLKHDMKLMGISELFPIVVACDPPMKRKPAPDLLLKAAEIMGATPEECAYVGDNIIDIQAAKAAGMVAIGFIIEGKTGQENRTKELKENGTHIVIDDFMDLREHLHTS